MTDAWHELEARVVDDLEARYRAEGFDVVREPELEGSSLCPDLLLTRGQETVLVEVARAARTRAEPAHRLEEYAEYAAKRGWRFTIVMVRGPNTFDEVGVPERQDVLRRLSDARALDAASWIAPIAATAAFEAAARYALTRAQASMPRPTPLSYVQALASRGMIAPDEEAVLRYLIEQSNEAAHGLPARPAPADTVAKALAIADALITAAPAAA